ncbi:MAG: hypothetical protein AB4352_29020 [Hormoscilla sp.]
MSFSSITEFSHCFSCEQAGTGRIPNPTQARGSALVQLNFEDLKTFERVTDQYQHLGVGFEQAIALSPSNPAFQPRTGSLALMPPSHQKSITVSFLRSIAKVGAYVSNVIPVTLTAYDEDGNRLGSASSQPCSFPEPGVALERQLLELEIEGVAYVTFYSDAPFILNDLFFLYL